MEEKVIHLSYKQKILRDFDWGKWDKGRKIFRDKKTNYKILSYDDLAKLMTALLRNGRFCQGPVRSAIKYGAILKIFEGIKYKLKKETKILEKYSGCIIGGAIGDASGYPIEFSTYGEIIDFCGEKGLNYQVIDEEGKARFSDDTQMALFTAEGILSSDGNPTEEVYKSYHRWLYTQEKHKYRELGDIYNGELINYPEMNKDRAPGLTCVASLRSLRKGTIENPINESKGCGAIMRVAPYGLAYEPETAFKYAVESSALAHGHPSGYISAGICSNSKRREIRVINQFSIRIF